MVKCNIKLSEQDTGLQCCSNICVLTFLQMKYALESSLSHFAVRLWINTLWSKFTQDLEFDQILWSDLQPATETSVALFEHSIEILDPKQWGGVWVTAPYIPVGWNEYLEIAQMIAIEPTTYQTKPCHEL
jgi:hypothetical protein